MSAGIGELAEHFFGVGFAEPDAQGRVGLHFGEALANFAFLGPGQDGGLLDLVAVCIEPAGEGASLGQRQRQHLPAFPNPPSLTHSAFRIFANGQPVPFS